MHNMKKRFIAWVIGALVSMGLTVIAAIAILMIALMTPYRNQGLLGAGIGIFSFAVVWPGLLTFCLILCDGFVTEGISKLLVVRCALWGLVPSIMILSLMKLGINWVGIAGNFGDNSLGVVFGLALFITPSLISAYLGVRTGLPRGSVSL